LRNDDIGAFERKKWGELLLAFDDGRDAAARVQSRLFKSKLISLYLFNLISSVVDLLRDADSFNILDVFLEERQRILFGTMLKGTPKFYQVIALGKSDSERNCC
jgi:hypothetical protein